MTATVSDSEINRRAAFLRPCGIFLAAFAIYLITIFHFFPHLPIVSSIAEEEIVYSYQAQYPPFRMDEITYYINMKHMLGEGETFIGTYTQGSSAAAVPFYLLFGEVGCYIATAFLVAALHSFAFAGTGWFTGQLKNDAKELTVYMSSWNNLSFKERTFAKEDDRRYDKRPYNFREGKRSGTHHDLSAVSEEKLADELRKAAQEYDFATFLKFLSRESIDKYPFRKKKAAYRKMIRNGFKAELGKSFEMVKSGKGYRIRLLPVE